MDDETGVQGTDTTDGRREAVAQPPRSRPGRRDDVTPKMAAEHLRERVYGTVALLADTYRTDTAAVTVAVTVGSLWWTSLIADLTARGARCATCRTLVGSLVSTRIEIVATAVVPRLLLGAAAAGWWELGTAPGRAASGRVPSLGLGLVGILAVHRADISWPTKVLVVAAEGGWGSSWWRSSSWCTESGAPASLARAARSRRSLSGWWSAGTGRSPGARRPPGRRRPR